MEVTQPEHQLAFEILAVFAAEFYTAPWPPRRNAAIANQLAAIEQSTRIGAPKKLPTPGAGTDAQQTKGVLQPFKIERLSRQDFFQRGVGFFGDGLVWRAKGPLKDIPSEHKKLATARWPLL
jgi:hypothetical protein